MAQSCNVNYFAVGLITYPCHNFNLNSDCDTLLYFDLTIHPCLWHKNSVLLYPFPLYKGSLMCLQQNDNNLEHIYASFFVKNHFNVHRYILQFPILHLMDSLFTELKVYAPGGIAPVLTTWYIQPNVSAPLHSRTQETIAINNKT